VCDTEFAVALDPAGQFNTGPFAITATGQVGELVIAAGL